MTAEQLAEGRWLQNDLALKERVLGGHRETSSWLRSGKLKGKHQREQFTKMHHLHEVHDRDLTLEYVVRVGYPLWGKEPDGAKEEKEVLGEGRCVHSLARALCILKLFSPGAAERMGCEPLHFCPSHKFFSKKIALSSRMDKKDKWWVYVPGALRTDGFYWRLHYSCWVPYVKSVCRSVQAIRKKGAEHKLGLSDKAKVYEYVHYGFDANPSNPTNFLCQHVLIYNPHLDKVLVAKIDSMHFNRMFLERMLSKDDQVVCPITLTPVRELGAICYCFRCYTAFHEPDFDKCKCCPVCRMAY